MMSENKRKRLPKTKTPQAEVSNTYVYNVMIGVRMPNMVDPVTQTTQEPTNPHIVVNLMFKNYPTVESITAVIEADPFIRGIDNFSGFYDVLLFGLKYWQIPVLPILKIHGARVHSVKTSWVANIAVPDASAKMHSDFDSEFGFISISEKLIN